MRWIIGLPTYRARQDSGGGQNTGQVGVSGAVSGPETMTVELTGQTEKSADETGQKENLAEKNDCSIAVRKQPEQDGTEQVKQEPNSATAEET